MVIKLAMSSEALKKYLSVVAGFNSSIIQNILNSQYYLKDLVIYNFLNI